eukprot:NODE_83_length_2227_cov_133.328283_g61_i0.p1 GENE.NODE_83_length_2227_cov_133.328283_g61_i0~~NODE_83_length_2227_cov_133.328283_g61_i0.p1  ORF type:complete len:482 (-),score=154.59 NODE_83_length_2227_cov_133.328283_g61_i0:315-1760(-)
MCSCVTPWSGASCSLSEQDPTANGESIPNNAAEVNAHREAIRAVFAESWAAYRRYAWGHDELRPVTKDYKDWVPDGVALTLLDALDTLHMLGFKEEFQLAKEWVRTNLTFDRSGLISTFELTIRALGGLLSAYALDGDPVFVQKAVDLTERLLKAVSPTTGIPYAQVNLSSGERKNYNWMRSYSILAEIGSIQLEYRYLSYVTNDTKYAKVATGVMDLLLANAPEDGLFPLYINTETKRFGVDHVSFGALGDSFYEYLLKQWLQTGRVESRYRDAYDRSVKGLLEGLLVKTDRWTFIGDRRQRRLRQKMDHLACFVPGMLVLGARPNETSLIRTAAALVDTCYAMYRTTKTGLSPDTTNFAGDEMRPMMRSEFYILRPEAVESMFYLWRHTKDPKYREMGWTIFQTIVKYCHVPEAGFSGIKNVNVLPPEKNNYMHSFWLAETLKYLYLLFSDDSALDLSAWTLNTEAHPLPNFVLPADFG